MPNICVPDKAADTVKFIKRIKNAVNDHQSFGNFQNFVKINYAVFKSIIHIVYYICTYVY